MRGQRMCGAIDNAAPALKFAAKSLLVKDIRQGIVPARPDSVAEEDRDPARFRKGGAIIKRDAAAGSEQFDLMPQRVGNGHGLTMTPKLLLTLRSVVVEDQEIAHRFKIPRHHAIEVLRELRFKIAVGEKFDQFADAGFHKMDARGFQRLEETTGEAQRDAVLTPRLAAASRGEFEQPGFGKSFAVEIGEQRIGGFIDAGEGVAEDMPVADPVLQRDAPLPASFVSGGAGVGRERSAIGAGNRKRAIARQPARPVFQFRFERAVDQQSGKSGAIDKEIARDSAPIG